MVVALGTLFAASAAAQRMPISRNVAITLKADRVQDFIAAVKDYNAIYSKLPGARGRIMYQTLSGPANYRLVLGYPDWAAMDATSPVANNAELARINARISSCIQSSNSVISEVLPDLSTPVTTPAPAPTLLRITRTRVRPDKIDEWMGIVKNELLPAYKKAGRTLTVRQARFGAPTNEFTMSTRVTNWADAGKNAIRDSMGADAYNKMVAKITALTTLLERDIVRYRADMSFAPAP